MHGQQQPIDDTKGAREKWVLLLAMVFPTIITYVYFDVLAAQPSAVQQIAGGMLKCMQFGLPIGWVLLNRQRLQYLRPSTSGLRNALLFGLASAIALVLLHRPLLSAMGVLDIAQQAVHQKVSELGFVSRGKYIGLAAFYTIAHSLLEEYYWRWFVFGRLRNHVGTAVANLISGIAFMGHHVIVLATFFGLWSPATWLCSLGVGLGGWVWAWMYDRSDRLFPVWISHALVDAAIFYIGYCFLFP